MSKIQTKVLTVQMWHETHDDQKQWTRIRAELGKARVLTFGAEGWVAPEEMAARIETALRNAARLTPLF